YHLQTVAVHFLLLAQLRYSVVVVGSCYQVEQRFVAARLTSA
ncbi:hypothetical protein CSB66_5020, partial [Enterobacter hormaechei]